MRSAGFPPKLFTATSTSKLFAPRAAEFSGQNNWPVSGYRLCRAIIGCAHTNSILDIWRTAGLVTLDPRRFPRGEMEMFKCLGANGCSQWLSLALVRLLVPSCLEPSGPLNFTSGWDGRASHGGWFLSLSSFVRTAVAPLFAVLASAGIACIVGECWFLVSGWSVLRYHLPVTFTRFEGIDSEPLILACCV